MRYRPLGTTGIEVSELSLGTWAFGGDEWGPADDETAAATIRAAFEQGVNLFDTADVYGYGHSEDVLRRALGPHLDEVIVCTKGGNDIYSTPRVAGGGPKDFSAGYLERAVEGSLARLGVDTLDVYLLHNPSLEVLRDGEAFATLARLQAAGKLRHYGASVYTAQEGRAAIDAGAAAVMITYNLIAQAQGAELFPDAAARGVGVLVRSPLASGVLSGKYSPNASFPADDHRAHRGPDWLRAGVTKAQQLEFLTRGGTRPLAQAALAFVLSCSHVSSVTVGARSPVQLQQNLQACDQAPLPDGELERIVRLSRTWSP
jgi:aryl-alcohol dehydrogenase-like predicted oxidoreductase